VLKSVKKLEQQQPGMFKKQLGIMMNEAMLSVKA
jgi:hypothetical protein